MSRLLLKILLIQFLPLALLAQQPEQWEKNIPGEYKITIFYQGHKLILDSNGSFYQRNANWSCQGTGTVKEYFGHYKVINNKVVFNPKHSIMSYYTNSYDDITDSLYQRDSILFDPQKELFRQVLFIVPWNKKLYLLSTDSISFTGIKFKPDILYFINIVNSGAYVDPNYGFYWSKPCESCTTSNLASLLPTSWKEYLLKKPIDARIIKIEPNSSKNDFEAKKKIVTINKGRIDGVRVGMKFYPDSSDLCMCEMEIIEVTNKSSKGITNVCGPIPCQSFTSLSTYLKSEEKNFERLRNK